VEAVPSKDGTFIGDPKPAINLVPAPALATENTRVALEFAQRAFSNSQELIRFMDQKANFALATTGALIAALGLLITQLDQPITGTLALTARYSGYGTAIVSGAAVAACVLTAADIYRARPGKPQPGLLFPLEITALVGNDSTNYLAHLRAADASHFLEAYAKQTVVLAGIYKTKQDAVNRIMFWFAAMVTGWFAAVILLAGSALL
jgi:hypothetical protein